MFTNFTDTKPTAKNRKNKRMKLSEAFPSNYLKAEDLNGRDVHVWIQSVEMQEIGQGREKQNKPVLTFKGKQKQFVCNITNAKTIAKLYGDDTDDWIGKPITLCSREVEFQGDMVLAIRVSLKAPPTGQQTPAKATPVAPPPAAPDDQDGQDVPF